MRQELIDLALLDAPDGWLVQSVHRNAMVRQIQVTKSRGPPSLEGLHTLRISDDGIRVFPRTILTPQKTTRTPRVERVKRAPLHRLSIGVPLLDKMLGGGLPVGYSLLISDPSGSGKSPLATAFLAEGARIGEKGVVAAFEEPWGTSRNPQLDDLVAYGHVVVVDTQALDLSIDETLFEMTESIRRTGARRIVIDSLSAFELALAPTFREDFRESLHGMVAALTGLGATVLRNSTHSRALRIFDITDACIVIRPPDPRIDALLSGQPRSASPVAGTPPGSIEPV